MMDLATLRIGKEARIVIVLAALSALLLIGSTPYIDMSYIAFAALVPLFLLVHTGSKRKHVLIATLFVGTAYGLAVLFPLLSLEGWWFATSPFFLAWETQLWAMVIILTSFVFFGLPFAVLFTLYRTPRRYLIPHTVAFALLWGLSEYLREVIVFGLSWGHLGYTLHNSTPFLQLAPIIGVYGMSALIVAVNILLSRVWVRMYIEKDRGVRSYAQPVLGLLLILLPPIGYGLYALAIHNTHASTNGPLSVAVLHTRLSLEAGRGKEGFTRYRALLEEAASRSPDIIVAPESIFHPIEIDRTTLLPVGYANNALVRERYEALTTLFSKHPDTAFVLGLKSRMGPDRYSSMVIFEDGELADIYDKRVPLPFAEQSESFHADRLVPPISSGTFAQTISISGYQVGASICSEIIYPRLHEKDTAFLINISNEDTFTDPVFAKQNHIMAKFRAVENRQHLLRATKDGYSSIISPTGEILSASNENETQILRAIIHVK